MKVLEVLTLKHETENRDEPFGYKIEAQGTRALSYWSTSGNICNTSWVLSVVNTFTDKLQFKIFELEKHFIKK